jgi:SAM-dependent methyltransferase
MSEKSAVADLIARGRDREAAHHGARPAPIRESAPAGTSKGETMTATIVPADLGELKTKQLATWASGNYAVIGTSLQLMGESLAEAVDVAAGSKVLDVAAGNGNASLAAARRGADVMCTDYVCALLDLARHRAQADGLHIATEVADVENLPFADEAYDTVLSTVGVMFAPNPERSSAEVIRVCKPGGKIGLANWTPEGFVGQMFKIVGAHVPPPAGVPSPLQWGTEARLNELFGADCDVEITRKHFVFRYRSAEDYFDTFINWYGPTVKAWAALDDAGKTSFRSQLTGLANAMNRATGSLAVPSEYLEVVATKR